MGMLAPAPLWLRFVRCCWPGINGYNGVWTVDHDDGSQFMNDTQNFMVCKTPTISLPSGLLATF